MFDETNTTPETPETEKTTVEERPVVERIGEQIEVAGNQLVEKVQEAVREGNARRLIIRNTEGDALLDVNLTMGAVAGGVVALAAPLIAAVAVIAAIATKVKVEIVRHE